MATITMVVEIKLRGSWLKYDRLLHHWCSGKDQYLMLSQRISKHRFRKFLKGPQVGDATHNSDADSSKYRGAEMTLIAQSHD